MAGEIPDYREIQEVLASVFDVDLENMEAITSYLTRNTSMESGLVVKPLKKKKGFMSFFK